MSSTKNPLHKAFNIDVKAHGDNTQTGLDLNANLEVISLGLSRTGTTSLAEAFTILGYGPSHGGIDLFREPWRLDAFQDIFQKVYDGTWKSGDPALNDRLRYMSRGYKSCTDTPYAYLETEIYPAFPKAKYILSYREAGAEAWFRSFMDAVGLHFSSGWDRTIFRTLISSVGFIRKNDDQVQLHRRLWAKKYGPDYLGPQWYDLHNDSVRRAIPEEQLLEFKVQDGWEPLCKFLGKPVPDVPFPNLNDTGSMKAIYFGMQAYGAFVWTLYLGGAAGAAYLAFRPELAKGLVEKALSLTSILASRLRPS